MHAEGKKSLHIKAKGTCVVTAPMIQTDQDVDVLIPDHSICALASDKEIDLEITCESGRKYRSAATIADQDFSIGVIPIDALFIPLKKVSYKTDDTRVCREIDYDKWTISIETDETVSSKNDCYANI